MLFGEENLTYASGGEGSNPLRETLHLTHLCIAVFLQLRHLGLVSLCLRRQSVIRKQKLRRQRSQRNRQNRKKDDCLHLLLRLAFTAQHLEERLFSHCETLCVSGPQLHRRLSSAVLCLFANPVSLLPAKERFVLRGAIGGEGKEPELVAAEDSAKAPRTLLSQGAQEKASFFRRRNPLSREGRSPFRRGGCVSPSRLFGEYRGRPA